MANQSERYLKKQLKIAREISEPIRIERSLMQANQYLNILSNVTRHDVTNQLTAIREKSIS